MKKLVFAVFSFISLSFPITLKQAQELALKNYPKIKELSYLSESKKASAQVVKLQRFGELELFLKATLYDDDYLLTPLSHLPNPQNPPPFDGKRLIYGVRFRAPLYLGGVLSRREEILTLTSKTLKEIKELTEWNIKFYVSRAYLGYLALSSYEKALKEYIKSLKKLKESTQAGVEVGKLAPVDLLKIDYELEKVEAKLEEIRNRKEYLLTLLETLTGVKISKVETYRVHYKPLEPSEGRLYELALKKNSKIEAQKIKLKISISKEKLTKAKYRPKLLLEGVYTQNHGLKTGENEDVAQASLILSYPFFDWNKRKYEILSAKLEKLSQKERLSEEKLKLRREISEAVRSIKTLQANIEVLKKRLRLAKEFERIEELKYLSGKGDIDHLLLAKAKRYLSEAELRSAYYNWEIAVRKLKTLLEEEYEKKD